MRGRRLWLEGAVIVVSILLAFGIEAGWAEVVERREARELLQRIRGDVEVTREILDQQIEAQGELAEKARSLLEALARHPEPDAEEALGTLGSVFVTGGWAPVNTAYREAVSSGRLQLIRDDALRILLTVYEESMEQIDQINAMIETQYYQELEPFLVANTIYSEIAAQWWRDSLVEAPFETDFEALAGSRELWNLLTLRLEAQVALLSRLDNAKSIADRLLSMLPEPDPGSNDPSG